MLLGRLAYHSSWRSLFPLPHRDQMIALECLDKVGLGDRALDRADALSGGEQQRIGLARAFAQQPSLILADEPIASLDPSSARHALQLLHDICKREGITAVLSLHQVDFAREFADRVVGVSNGQVVFDGTARQLTEAQLSHIYDRPARLAKTENAAAPHSFASLTAEIQT